MFKSQTALAMQRVQILEEPATGRKVVARPLEAWKTVIEPLDAREGEFEGQDGHWCDVYFPPYFQTVTDGKLKDSDGQDIPQQVILVKPRPLQLFLKREDNYPGVLKVIPKAVSVMVKRKDGSETELLFRPQAYEFYPPTSLFANVPKKFQAYANVPRYRRVEPLSIKSTDGVQDVDADGQPGHWYVVFVPTDQFELPKYVEMKEGEDSDLDSDAPADPTMVTMTHPPLTVFVRSSKVYSGHVALATDDECTIENSSESTSAQIARRKFRFWPPPVTGQLVPKRFKAACDLQPDQRLEFVGYQWTEPDMSLRLMSSH